MSVDSNIGDTADDHLADLDPARLAHGVQGDEILLARFGKRAGQAIFVRLIYLSGWRLDIRVFFFDEGRQPAPTKRGVTLSIDRLDTIADAIARARDAADKAGLTVASTSVTESLDG